MVGELPTEVATVVSAILYRGGWLFGSTIRKILTGETLTDFDMILPNGGALFHFLRLPKRRLNRHLWDVGGYHFHVCPRIDFKFLPMFDVDMLGLSRSGISVRPLSPAEELFTYDCEAILAKIARKQFSIYPAHERSFYFETKLANLLAHGWTQIT